MNKKLLFLILCCSSHAFSNHHFSYIQNDENPLSFDPKVKVFSESFNIDEDYFCDSEKDLNKALSNSKTQNQNLITSKFDKDNSTDYWTCGFDNIMQRPYGEQTTPSKLHAEISKLISEVQWIPSKKVMKPFSGQEVVLYKSMNRSNGTSFVITAPGHDIGEDGNIIAKVAAGEISVKEIVQEVLQNKSLGKVEICIPVAQANNLLGLFKRNHWTTLNLEVEDGKIQNANLIDSKGWLSSLYRGGLKIQSQLPVNAPKVKTVYTGHQGLFNNKDCGRFTAAYTMARAENKKVETMSTKQVTGFFNRFNLWK